MHNVINSEKPLEVTIPPIQTMEALKKEILAISQQGPKVAGRYVAQKAEHGKAMSRIMATVVQSSVRTMYLAGAVIRIMRDEVLKHTEYEDWVRNVCKIDTSTAWRWAEFSNLAYVQDLDCYKSRRQALIAFGLIKVKAKATVPKVSRLPSGPAKAQLLLAAPAPAQKSSKAASPSKRTKKTTPPPRVATQVATQLATQVVLSLPAAIRQLEGAIAASVKRPVNELSTPEREDLQEMLRKLIAITRNFKEAIYPKLRTES